MYLLEVSPVSRGSRETLTYYSEEKVTPGTLVTIPLRRQSLGGIVMHSMPLREAKAHLKTLNYRLRKISRSKQFAELPSVTLSILEQLAEYYATTPGAVFESLAQVDAIPIFQAQVVQQKKKSAKVTGVEGSLSDRAQKYAQQATESDGITLIIVPTYKHGKKLEEEIKIHTELSLHRLLAKRGKRNLEQWQALATIDRSIIIGTYPLLLLPHPNISQIVIDDCENTSYKLRTRPFLDIRTIASLVSEIRGIPAVFGDSFLSGRVATSGVVSFEKDPESVQIVDWKTLPNSSHGHIFSDPVVDYLIQSPQTSRTVILTPRTGLAPLTICKDCSTVLRCPISNHPLVLHEDNGKRIYRCHSCRRSYSANIRCSVCEGVQFDFAGIGIQAVEKDAKRIFKDRPVHVAIEPRGSDEKIETWNLEGGLLVVHGPMLPHLPKSWDDTVVITLDSLFSIPDIGMEEKIAQILFDLRQRTKHSLLVQQRNAVIDLLHLFTNETTSKARKTLTSVREKAQTPPNTVYVRLSWPVQRPHADPLQNVFSHFNPVIYEGYARKGRKELNLLISIPKNRWPHSKVVSFLRGLPPDIAVDIEPVSIL